MMQEQWKEWTRDDLTGMYLISNLGRVRSKQSAPPELLKPYKNMGYRAIPVRKMDGKNTLVYVHKIVAELFVKRSKGEDYIIFVDGTLNPQASNLKWVDKKGWREYRSGYYVSPYANNPDHKPAAKLKRTQVAVIKRLLKNDKAKPTKIAKRFSVGYGVIYSIKNEKSWKNIK